MYGFDGAKLSSGTGTNRYNFSDANDLFKTFFSAYGFDSSSDTSFFETYLKAAFGKGTTSNGTPYYRYSNPSSSGGTTYYTSSSFGSKPDTSSYFSTFNKYANGTSGGQSYGNSYSSYGSGNNYTTGKKSYGTYGGTTFNTYSSYPQTTTNSTEN